MTTADATPIPARISGIARDALAQFVAQPDYPCLGARSAIRRGGCRTGVYGAMGSAATTAALAADLAAFARDEQVSSRRAEPCRDLLSEGSGRLRREGQQIPTPASRLRDDSSALRNLHTFAAIFVEPAPLDEAGFEAALWDQLTRLNDADPSAAWASGASDDPDDPHFAFSFADTAFFVIGLHPASSRLARRFGWPALVFNPHAQFARLRAEDRFEGLRQSVRTRDIALQGDINPNLADVGERSEARQYSGRATGDAWRCPFHRGQP